MKRKSIKRKSTKRKSIKRVKRGGADLPALVPQSSDSNSKNFFDTNIKNDNNDNNDNNDKKISLDEKAQPNQISPSTCEEKLTECLKKSERSTSESPKPLIDTVEQTLGNVGNKIKEERDEIGGQTKTLFSKLGDHFNSMFGKIRSVSVKDVTKNILKGGGRGKTRKHKKHKKRKTHKKGKTYNKRKTHKKHFKHKLNHKK
jgi:hypothetical protein